MIEVYNILGKENLSLLHNRKNHSLRAWNWQKMTVYL